VAIHLVHDIALDLEAATTPMVVEIPAGTSQKWTTDWDSGELYWEQEAEVPRLIRFCPYPFNYGFVPQTWCDPALGGDGDPLDILLLDEAQPRGAVTPTRVIGGLSVVDRGEQDMKLIAVLPEGILGNFHSLDALLAYRPGLVGFLTQWFESYKGPGLTQVSAHVGPEQAHAVLAQCHASWQTRAL